MEWIETPESSNIARFGYENQTLTVEFLNGGTYNYWLFSRICEDIAAPANFQVCDIAPLADIL